MRLLVFTAAGACWWRAHAIVRSRAPFFHPQTGDFCALKLLNSSAGRFDPPFGRNTFEYYLLLSGAC